MQHLERGPERVHLCKRKRKENHICHRYRNKHTKIQQSQFVFPVTIIFANHLSPLCVSRLIHNKHILAATKSWYHDWFSKTMSPSLAFFIHCIISQKTNYSWVFVWDTGSTSLICLFETKNKTKKKANRGQKRTNCVSALKLLLRCFFTVVAVKLLECIEAF